MKNTLLILLVFIMFGCDKQDITDTLIDATRVKNYKIVLVDICDSSINSNSVCVSKSEYDKYIVLSKSCDIVTITSLNGNKYSGIISSFNSNDTPCKSK